MISPKFCARCKVSKHDAPIHEHHKNGDHGKCGVFELSKRKEDAREAWEKMPQRYTESLLLKLDKSLTIMHKIDAAQVTGVKAERQLATFDPALNG